MFFIGIFGIDQAHKELGTRNNIVCPSCSAWSRLQISKTYSYFHIFFIPTFRWNTRYLAQAACCGTLFELDPAVGAELEQAWRHDPSATGPDIRAEHLRPLGREHAAPGRSAMTCPHCNRQIPDASATGYQYCPFCGKSLR